MEYLDFDLHVSLGVGREYPVSVSRSPAGEAGGTMRFPFDTLALAHHLQGVEIAVLRSGGVRRDIVDREAVTQPVREFGRQLFEALMTDAVRDAFRRSRDRAKAERKGLRLRLRVDAPELAALPWEFLYDPAERDFVCLSSDTPLVRYLSVDRPPEPTVVEPPLSILGVLASPGDRAALDVAQERRRMDAATASLRAARLLKLTWLDGSTWRDVQRAMRQGPYHVLHFVGHGGFDAVSGEGILALTDDDGRAAPLSATQLGRLVCDHRSLRLVVLNACLGARASATDVFSSTAATLIGRGVPAVVAMQYEISDTAAVEFARALYEALADELPIDAAVSEARKAISLAQHGSVEWGTPVVHMRAPDGRLFAIKRTTSSDARPSGTHPRLSAPALAAATEAGGERAAVGPPAPEAPPVASLGTDRGPPAPAPRPSAPAVAVPGAGRGRRARRVTLLAVPLVAIGVAAVVLLGWWGLTVRSASDAATRDGRSALSRDPALVKAVGRAPSSGPPRTASTGRAVTRATPSAATTQTSAPEESPAESPAEPTVEPPALPADGATAAPPVPMLERLSGGTGTSFPLSEGDCVDFDGSSPRHGCERDFDVRWPPGNRRLVPGAGARLADLGEISQAAFDAFEGAALQRSVYAAADIAVPATTRAAIAVHTADGHYVVLRRVDDGRNPRRFWYRYLEFGPPPGGAR